MNRWSRQSIQTSCATGGDSLSRRRALTIHIDTGLSESPCVISQGNLLVSVLPRSIPKTSELRDSISKVRLGQSES